MKYLIIARNIVNQNDVDDFIQEVSNNISNTDILSWINTQLRKYIQEEITTVKPFTKLEKNQPQWLQNSIKNKDAFEVFFKPRFKADVKHILDYFIFSLTDNPKELSKISKLKFDVALDKSRKWTQELNKKTGDWDDFKGIEIVRKYKGGMKWVRVFSKQACEREGKVMDHCSAGYYKDVRDGLTSLYSLRDNSNIPHCTIEVKDDGVNQIKGYSDFGIGVSYQEYVLDFLNNPIFKKKFTYFNDLELAGLKIENGKIKSSSIFNKKIVNGDLTILDILIPFTQDFLHVKGSINFRNSKLNYFPNTLIVDGDMYLNNSNILELPPNLTVKGELSLSGTEILEIPENAKINSLYINDCRLTSLPDNFKVENLTIGDNVKITELPRNLTVTDLLDLEYNRTIKELPKDIKFGSIISGKGIK